MRKLLLIAAAAAAAAAAGCGGPPAGIDLLIVPPGAITGIPVRLPYAAVAPGDLGQPADRLPDIARARLRGIAAGAAFAGDAAELEVWPIAGGRPFRLPAVQLAAAAGVR